MLKQRFENLQTRFLGKMREFPVLFELSREDFISVGPQVIPGYINAISQYINVINVIMRIHGSETKLRLDEQEYKKIETQLRILKDINKILSKNIEYVMDKINTLKDLWNLFKREVV